MTATPNTQPAQPVDGVIAQPAPVVHKQPIVSQPMNPEQPHPEPSQQEMGLRGGDRGRGGMCPGRFCFIIPCPIPCDFCVFPCPC
ncbi:uncharacterized protein B0I36DRAFT_369147 [Microdochium trichocladiopsis]|uniref:Uncharacterized protein n=1 Tax=Microdochium trichocladiopsis TaxID=1682393 RepID=A0A9P8XUT8_9PEZI|nr:uncharacterized protein B0I36DRAFT_369147 [Microdochium trichocladiopsis]KAH7014158.1 hypothetical protein B0I36DRAFT_369147 [Microdochium trichocladiopsis]